MDDIDLVNRDPKNLNNFIEIKFNDSIAETEMIHIFDCIWLKSFTCFNCGKNNCYKILTYIFGVFTALGWGCTFGCLTFSLIWCIIPFMRFLQILLYPTRQILMSYFSTFVGPCLETVGLFLSRIKVVNSQGKPPKQIDALDGEENQIEGFFVKKNYS